jgi:hypothetical protein
MPDESRLHRVQPLGRAQSLDRGDAVALVHHGEAQARIDPPSVDVHRARAALAMIASFFGSSQMQMLAQAIQKSRARIDPKIVLLAVNSKRYWNCVLRGG